MGIQRKRERQRRHVKDMLFEKEHAIDFAQAGNSSSSSAPGAFSETFVSSTVREAVLPAAIPYFRYMQFSDDDSFIETTLVDPSGTDLPSFHKVVQDVVGDSAPP